MKINQVVSLGFGAVFVVAGLSTLISHQNLMISEEADELVSHTFQVKLQLRQLEKRLVDAETGQLGFILTEESHFLIPYTEAESKISEDLRQLQEEVRGNDEQVRRAEELERLAQVQLSKIKEAIELQQSGNVDRVRAIISSGQSKLIMDQIQSNMAEMIEFEEELLEKRERQVKQMTTVVNFVNWGGLLVIVIVGSVASYVIIRVIMHPINDVTGVIVNSSAEIAASATQQEQVANDQAVSIRQTTTTLDELAISAEQSAQQAQASLTAAEQALQVSATGNEAVQETLLSMKDLKDSVDQVAQQIQVLTQYTNQIEMISGLVSQLANQTNMLALNASVEAVRAGEYGRGFNVVAQEIRKLADQSYASAGKINTLIDTIQNTIHVTVNLTNQGTKNVSQGMTLTEKTASLFGDVSGAVDHVVINSQQISLTAQQQAIAIQQVVDISNQINDSATQTVSGITQTKVSTQELNKAAQNLQELV